MEDARRRIPRTDVALAHPDLLLAIERVGAARVRAELAAAQDRCRAGYLAPEEIIAAAARAAAAPPATVRRAINATGIVVHTNLGRAPLSEAARQAISVAAGYTDVELDLATGRRRRRGLAAMQALQAAVPEAPAVHVVNNGAAALSLAASALAKDREIVVARGEMVEIGDGFRIHELLQASGAHLHEVGTTNRVHVEDYMRAIGERTGFILKVHPSNYRVEGFTTAVGVARLSKLGVPVIADIGSGLLHPHPRLPDEPDATTQLRAGAHLVTASGDKLLGGPQCGLLLGDERTIDVLRRHPMARALRVDKLTLAALEATLKGPPPPVAVALRSSREDLLARATAIVNATRVPEAAAVMSEALVGGGGASGVPLPSAAVALPTSYSDRLRTGSPPVVGRVHGGQLLLDLIAVPPSDDNVLAAAIRRTHERCVPEPHP